MTRAFCRAAAPLVQVALTRLSFGVEKEGKWRASTCSRLWASPFLLLSLFFFFPHAYFHLPNGFLLTSLCSWPTMSSGGTNCQHLFIFLVYSHEEWCLFFMIRGFIAFLWGEQAAALDFNANITIPRPGQNRQELKGWLSPLEVLSGTEKFLSACVEDLQKSFKSWRLQYAPLRLSQTCSELEIKRRVGICHLQTNCVLKAAVD